MVDQLQRGAQMVMSPMCCLEQNWFPEMQFVDSGNHEITCLCFCIYLGYSTWIDEDYIGRVFAQGKCKMFTEMLLSCLCLSKVSRMSRRCHAFTVCISTMRRALMHYKRKWNEEGWLSWGFHRSLHDLLLVHGWWISVGKHCAGAAILAECGWVCASKLL